MRKITVLDTRTIVIGRMGENQAAQVVWPGLLEKWRGLYGEGTVQLTVQRPEDTAPYPAVIEISGDDVTWTVSAADTAQRGTGACELSYIVGDTVAKSQTWATLTLKSLSGDGTEEPPEAQQSWVDKVLEVGAEVASGVESAEKAAASAEESAKQAEVAIGRLTTFEVIPETGELMMYKSEGYSGPEFSLNENGELEVEIDV